MYSFTTYQFEYGETSNILSKDFFVKYMHLEKAKSFLERQFKIWPILNSSFFAA